VKDGRTQKLEANYGLLGHLFAEKLVHWLSPNIFLLEEHYIQLIRSRSGTGCTVKREEAS
jgi:hypothetical protein